VGTNYVFHRNVAIPSLFLCGRIIFLLGSAYQFWRQYRQFDMAECFASCNFLLALSADVWIHSRWTFVAAAAVLHTCGWRSVTGDRLFTVRWSEAQEKSQASFFQTSQSHQPQMSSTGMDPFLGGSTSTFHQRDASLDSGVGMGSNYSLSRTPDDYLSNVEDMDTGRVSSCS